MCYEICTWTWKTCFTQMRWFFVLLSVIATTAFIHKVVICLCMVIVNCKHHNYNYKHSLLIMSICMSGLQIVTIIVYVSCILSVGHTSPHYHNVSSSLCYHIVLIKRHYHRGIFIDIMMFLVRCRELKHGLYIYPL